MISRFLRAKRAWRESVRGILRPRFRTRPGHVTIADRRKEERCPLAGNSSKTSPAEPRVWSLFLRPAVRSGAARCRSGDAASRSWTCTVTAWSRRSRNSSRTRRSREPSRTSLGGANLALGPERLRYMDEQGIDVQALSINAWWYGTDRDAGAPDRHGAKRKDGGLGAGPPGSVRRVGVGRAAASGSGGRAAGGSRQEAGTSRRGDRRQRRRRGAVGAQVRSVLGESGGAGHHDFHAPAAGARHDAESTAAGKGRSRQHHRQSAGDHRVFLPSDFRRDAGPIPGTQDLRGSRRRLPALLQRPVRRAVRRAVPAPIARP